MHPHRFHSLEPTTNIKNDASFYSTFILTFAVLLSMGWLCHRSQVILEGAELWEAHTLVVITELSQLLSSIKDAETGQRGYVITGRQEYLEPFASSITKIEPHLDALRRLTADNRSQQQRLVVITPLVAAKIAELKATVEVRITGGMEAARAMVTINMAKNLADQIHVLADQAQQEEAQLLVQRTGMRGTALRDTNLWFLLTAVLGSLTVVILFIRLGREMDRRSIENELRAHRNQLVEQVNIRTRDLRATRSRMSADTVRRSQLESC